MRLTKFIDVAVPTQVLFAQTSDPDLDCLVFDSMILK